MMTTSTFDGLGSAAQRAPYLGCLPVELLTRDAIRRHDMGRSWKELNEKIYSTDIYRRQSELVNTYIGRELARRHAHEYLRGTYRLIEKAESAAEAVFAIWWEAITAFLPEPNHLYLEAQQEIELSEDVRRRADFCLFCTDRELLLAAEKQGLLWTPILIEIDGHAFHEKTREQVTERNQRDRDLQIAGFPVIHFSYDELVREPHRCVGEALDAGRDQLFTIRESLTNSGGGPPL